ncbi:hypothetical protein EDD37DRAFT_698155 [Exophiala viscosa]|uniref:SCP domain-containing protein n=1 Tax=Exophiala viscosa TaxID=2486360 RepID=A0AAN6DKV4_9EURO|nr:hypothetical protein EDD36DRAFT_479017 [Exophiala viscosa]KAI1620154.1 hypothetical protein EDD37DRAFT_698155 [Exophiala viscosa]
MKVSTTAITALAAASQAAASWTDWVDPDATVTSTVTQTHTYCPCNGEVSYTPVDPDYTDVVVYTTETGTDYTDVVVYTTESGEAVAPAAATTPAGTTITKAGAIVVVFETEGSTSTKTGMAIELIIAPTGTETETSYVTKTVWTGAQPTNDLEWVDWDDSSDDDGATLTRTHTLVTTLYEAVDAFPTETDTESWADWAATTNTFTVTTETSVTLYPSSSGNAVGPIGASMNSSTSSSASVAPVFANSTSTSSSSTSVLAPVSANSSMTSSSSSSSTSSSTTTSSTSTATTVAAGETIEIIVTIDSTKKNKRDTYYVGISDDNVAVLGSLANVATFITGDDGTLLYGADYLGSNPTSDDAAAYLEVFTSIPTDSVWLMDASGMLTLSERQFCVLSSLTLETVDAAGDNCDGTLVTFTAVSATTSTSTSSSTTTSTTSSSSSSSTSVLAPVSATTTSTTSTTSSKTSSSSSSTTSSTSTTSSKTSSSTTSSTSTSTTTTTTTTTSSGSLPTTTDNVTGDDYETGILFAHNVHRANHSASDLTWNDDMATYAAETAATCNYQHNLTAGGGNYGQNIGAGYTSTHVPIMIGNDMYNAEMPNYPTPYGEDNPDTSDFSNWGHFSQIVWKATTGVGCATQYCDTLEGATFTNYFTVCNYYPAGNVGGEYSNVGAPLGEDVVVIEVDD